MQAAVLERFSYSQYTVRRKVLKLLGGAFHLYGPDGQLVLYSKMKAFKLKEDFRLYTGEDMQTEVLTIRARRIIDFSSAYDVVDPVTGQKIGALKHKGLKSIIRDEWIIMDETDREIGLIREESTWLAVARRMVEAFAFFFPQKYHAQIQGVPVCTFRQRFNPFVFKLDVDFSPDTNGCLDRRLGLAAALLLTAIEGRQQQ